jgi:probable phosphoglycerate mutase
MPSLNTHIIAVRHGETAWNKAMRIQGHLDIDLNATGRAQAQAVARGLGNVSVDAVYSSDLGRAVATATPMAQAKGLVIHQLPGLRERHFGVWQGETYPDIEKNHPLEFARWRDREPAFAVQDAESLVVFQERIATVLTTLAVSHAGQTIAVFTHGGCLDIVYRLAHGIDLAAPRTWSIANAVVNRLVFDGERLHCLAWGQADHLDSVEA